nr:MAG TPA: hypothetical protein [Caudoviricetes sp.]
MGSPRRRSSHRRRGFLAAASVVGAACRTSLPRFGQPCRERSLVI